MKTTENSDWFRFAGWLQVAAMKCRKLQKGCCKPPHTRNRSARQLACSCTGGFSAHLPHHRPSGASPQRASVQRPASSLHPGAASALQPAGALAHLHAPTRRARPPAELLGQPHLHQARPTRAKPNPSSSKDEKSLQNGNPQNDQSLVGNPLAFCFPISSSFFPSLFATFLACTSPTVQLVTSCLAPRLFAHTRTLGIPSHANTRCCVQHQTRDLAWPSTSAVILAWRQSSLHDVFFFSVPCFSAFFLCKRFRARN